MRRPAPRALDRALASFRRDATPRTLLARIQACWPEVVGEAVAREATPMAERSGTITVECRSGAWAHELTLLAPELVTRLNTSLGDSPATPIAALRFRPEAAAEGAEPDARAAFRNKRKQAASCSQHFAPVSRGFVAFAPVRRRGYSATIHGRSLSAPTRLRVPPGRGLSMCED